MKSFPKDKNFNIFEVSSRQVFYIILFLPGTGPHTRGIISNIAEHDGSSKHNWRASMQFNIAIAIFTFGPITNKKKLK